MPHTHKQEVQLQQRDSATSYVSKLVLFFHEVWELERFRFQKAKVTFKVIKSIGKGAIR